MSNTASFTGNNFDGTDDVLDSRDITARIEELIAEWEEVTEDTFSDYAYLSTDDLSVGLTEEDAEELHYLIAFRDEHDNIFSNEESFISDDYFEAYTEETVKDCGYIPQDLPGWIEIDWSETADNLKADYSSYDFRGTTYWARD